MSCAAHAATAMDPDHLADGHSRVDNRIVVGGRRPLPPDPPPGLSQVEVDQWLDRHLIEKNDREPEITDKKTRPQVVEDTETATLELEDLEAMIE